MPGLFGQALTALQGFLSRAFWFGSFLPVASFAALNLLLAHHEFGFGGDLSDIVIADKWPWGIPIVTGLIVLAYATAPLVPLCRTVLDGKALPDWVFERLQEEPLGRRRRAKDLLDSRSTYLEQVDFVTAAAAAQLPMARGVGVTLGTAANADAVTDAQKRVERMERQVAKGKAPPIAKLRVIIDVLRSALERNSADVDTRLDRLAFRNGQILLAARANGNALYKRRLERSRNDATEAQPTAIANARHLSELYTRTVYNADFDFLWPRVQMVIPEADPANRQIETARSLVEFAVLSLVLAFATLAVWLPVLAIYGASVWHFLVLGVVGPLLLRFCYQLVVQSQVGLGQVAQGIVDRYRRELLKTLHIAPPATLAAERELWRTLSRIANGEDQKADLVWTSTP